ncbi:hypothetical protein D9758_015809 [Tetrapyrgos nigripes]|uniref:rhamnogalacturonan endolyase n=1 Tax=Tetrapyrgos nigripes TaxID=182062 RepID=A0A8H5FC09_9AGAR|nr:hypothetical protein D9758_015809 [Tetrapyrgos nigripes]
MIFLPLVLLAYLSSALAEFGVTTDGNNLLVDSGAGLVTTINMENGDITSLDFNGKQLQDSSKFTQLSSGLGSASVSHTVDSDIAVITIKTDTITHYYIVRSGENSLYMGTHASEEPEVGELRLIARLNKDNLPNGTPESDVEGGEVIEGEDVFLIDGQTRSKFYSSVRFIEDQVHGATGDGVGAFMIIPGTGYEKSSGGPFHRDIDNQGTSQQEVYFYMNSNHEQTEQFRTGFFGPYALAFTDGTKPSGDLDTSFFDDLGLEGYVPASDRGTVTGTYSGTLSGLPVTIGFANNAAQYWASGSSGEFSGPRMKPGTYDVTLYQGELEAGSSSVTISEGNTAKVDLKADLDKPDTIWSIGTPDGRIESMHPSDSRMSDWGPLTFTIGDDHREFPMAQFQDVNDPTTITWTASSEEIGARTLRIRTTSAFASGRPQITVNDYKSDVPPAPTKVDSRGVTRGTWRGLNQVYDFDIPENTLKAGENTITISVASGSSGDGFLSPNFVYDSVELF